MTKIRLDYIHEYQDRHGKLRRYFRRPGFKRIALPGMPGSDEFMTAYQLALAGQPPRVEIGAGRTKPGTVNAAIVGYYNSVAFRSLALGTQKLQRSILERFRVEHGDKRIAMLPREFIVRTLGRRSPSVARNWLKTLRALLQFAITEGFRADDPTQGVKPPRIKTDGFHTWTEDEIAQYEARHPIGTKARLALALLLYTAQRRSDVVGMGRQHVRNGMIAVRQQKTGTMLSIPIHPKLQEALAAAPDKHLTFLVTEFGKPFSIAGFGNWFRGRCIEAGLPKKCSTHGLRKAACRRLAEAGCTAHQIAAISGHLSLREVERYTKAADQAELARQAFEKEQRRTNIG
jgi:integrase